jgi:cyclic pyranopterin phosphate synthase
LRFDEIERVVRAFVDLGGHRVRLTGGEPLVRRNLPDLARRLSALDGLADLSLSSNCTRMSRMAEALRKAGVQRLNVSLDTLDPQRFREITGGRLDKVLAGIEAARDAGFAPIRINTVVMKGVNDTAIGRILEYSARRGFTLRLIETVPMGDTGRDAVGRFVDLQKVKKQLEKDYELIPDVLPGGGPARYYRLAGTDTRIGFITPLSQHFCEACNRVRLTVDGTLHMCLGQEYAYPLRELLRAGVTDEELCGHITAALALKPERHEFREKPEKVIRFMSMTGG